tara:strand:+ start:104 stop:226 length:123 start_codon:yes stop_codon:yes gene_type:complete
MAIITHLIVWGVGLATGIYFSSQIEKHIDNNTNNKTKDKA